MKSLKTINVCRITTIILICTLLISCSRTEDATPTLFPEQIQTEAVATFATGLTQTAASLPTETSTPIPSATPTETATTTQTPQATAVRFLPTSSCYALTFVKDLTIPDNTNLQPGEDFTKTWRVKNSGSCDWEKGFTFSFLSGNALGGADYLLPKAVPSGSDLDISIKMKAPKTEGVYTGNWRMTDDSGKYFGDNVYDLIEVAAAESQKTPVSPTIAATITATFETPPSETAAPE